MRDGSTPKALAKRSGWAVEARYLTKLPAAALLLLADGMPQQLVKVRAPLTPVGPAGIGTASHWIFGWLAFIAPMIQLPSVDMAALPRPKASPAQPELSCSGNLRIPCLAIDCTHSSALMFWGELKAKPVPALFMYEPPFSAKKAPKRSRLSPTARPVTVLVVSFLESACNLAHVVGRSALVRPAAFHMVVLISTARFEKSFGTQYHVLLYVYAFT